MDAPTIEVNNLTKRFGRFTAVNALSFAVQRGEIFGFLGPNGAGKSTTIRMLCGILKPSTGSGSVIGYDIAKQQSAIRQHIGYMSQRFSLYGDLTVAENIEFYGGIYGLSKRELKQRQDAVLEMAGLLGREQRLAAELSGGWKQRLALGCAIVHQPRVLFLDEPTSGADPISRRRFWDLIYQMAEEGVTILVTTHYMAEAEHCDRLAMIHRGTLVALGTPAQLRKNYQGALLLVECEPLMRGLEVLSQAASVSDVALLGASLHVTVSDPHTATNEVTSLLNRAQVTLHQIEPILPSLEDVFVSLVDGGWTAQ